LLGLIDLTMDQKSDEECAVDTTEILYTEYYDIISMIFFTETERGEKKNVEEYAM
jgi:hypothetical protein